MPNPFAAFTGDTAGFFGDNPESAYYSYQNQWKTPNQKRHFQSQFANIQNQYLGQLGQMVKAGGAPTLQFANFLEQFPWAQQFQSQTPQQRGEDISRFNPFTRWLV